MKVVFAIPTITGEIRAECVMSLMQALAILMHKGIETDLHILSNCPVLPVARASLAAMFMQDEDATDHFFIDYDVGFPGDAVVKVLDRPEEIVAGAYRVKVDDHEEYSVVPKTQDGVPVGRDGLVEAEFLAAGFMRVKRAVYERMADSYPGLRYEDNVVKSINGTPIQQAWDFFGMGVDQERKRYTTEDYYFCKRWRDIGGQLWIYPDIHFHHIGRKAYAGNYHEWLLGLPGGAKSELKLQKARSIHGWMKEQELVWLAQRARFHGTIVELGSWLGRSTRAMADNTHGVVFALDDWKGPRDIEQFDANVQAGILPAFKENMADLIEQNKVFPVSVDHADCESLTLPTPDMVFIDGHHSYEAAKRDIQTWRARMTTGGLLCGHDYDWLDVKRAVDELLPGATQVPGTTIWQWHVPQGGSIERIPENDGETERLAATCT